jgi:ParB family chromosome partitioning protein
MNVKRIKGLGRGLDALLGEQPQDPSAQSSLPQTLPLSSLRPGRYQPRTRMDPAALAELADSIRAQGIIQPILVRPVAEGAYEIIAGERRFRAAALAGLTEAPVTIREVPDEAALAMALIENIQREDLSAIEEAHGVERLVREFQFTHEQAAQAIGRSRSATTNLLRLLQLSRAVQDLLAEGRLEMGHARALLALDGASQVRFAQEIISRELSVREAEALVQRELTRAPEPAPGPAKPGGGGAAASAPRSRDLERLEQELSDTLATRVRLLPTRKGAGRIVIDYANLDQLQGVLDILRGSEPEDVL